MLKVLGINFSPRNSGNCFYSLQYSLNKMKEDNHVVKMIHFYELNISPCKECNYECFDTGCIIEDDLKKL